ncbi:adenine methyltransferase [Levilactobacillus paucivorans]|uniref:site-specific DNA-methyltransferase (adenine-specific) n=1 Tax=Levilactobacillus paucivorans TaxID=616990 RepID=A0A0R2LCP1_9LACO|nr:DNA adenine methylase [Levilactobacillus paucivorans]KRN97637.1 adenine methyltransferase [Levilactobacillus paucivorans]
MIRSFLNYPGGKYRILDQIRPLFPKKYARFVDLFTGSAVVAVNNYDSEARVEAYDINGPLIRLLKYVQRTEISDLMRSVISIIEEYDLTDTFSHGYEYYGANSGSGLSSINKNAYIKLRDVYNNQESQNRSPIFLYVLIVFGFNNQIRFNNSGKFNNPVGKRDFNKNMRDKLIEFSIQVKNMDITFGRADFRLIDNRKQDSFFYVDPPYLITTAVYNENGGWTAKDENDLLAFLDEVDQNGNKFALSNVFENKGQMNELLIDWSSKYNVHHIDRDYGNSNYQHRTRNGKTDEVLITNY